MNQISKSERILNGIDGSNPLAFLASLGVLRTLALARPENDFRMGWRLQSSWHPELQISIQLSDDEMLDILFHQLARKDSKPEFTRLGDDLTVKSQVFREFAMQSCQDATENDRVTADFAAAFGCELPTNNDEAMPDTALRTMAGAGHQHFLGFMRNIIRATSVHHLRKALFDTWRYDDPVQNLTLRWDPIDDVRYALRWRNPSGDPLRRYSGSMLGANRLAIEGLPLVGTVPLQSHLATTGFRGRKSTNTYWTWPIWESPCDVDVVRSLLQLNELQKESPDRSELAARGIVEVFRSQRLTIGKVRNFTPGQSV